MNKKISSKQLENSVKIKNLDKEVQDLINKYTEYKNVSVYGEDNMDDNEGFFLIWMKKDINNSEHKLKVTTFGQMISFDDIRDGMEQTIKNIINEQAQNIGTA